VLWWCYGAVVLVYCGAVVLGVVLWCFGAVKLWFFTAVVL
jgi:hypothetical protein